MKAEKQKQSNAPLRVNPLGGAFFIAIDGKEPRKEQASFFFLVCMGILRYN